MVYNYESLKNSNKCNLKRELKIPSCKTIAPEAEVSLFCTELLKDLLFGRAKPYDAKEQIEAFFDTLDFPSEATRQAKKNDMLMCLNRYLKCETRNATVPFPVTSKIYGLDVNILPDAIFYNNDGYLEIVKYYYKKPDITRSGKKEGHCARAFLPLYCLLWYGQQIVPEGDTLTVRASLYFLKKNTDNFTKGEFENDFFEDFGKNVISIDNSYTGGQQVPSYWDKIYEPQVKAFLEGQNAFYDKDDCKYCELCNICSYKECPKPIHFTKTVASIDSIPFTNEQLDAINFTNGVARINAGAGAGKTLVIALRTVNLLLNGVKPENICLLTFTNSGAREMRERISVYLEQLQIPIDANFITINTFNGFGDSIIQKEYKNLGFEKVPRLIDEVERMEIVAKMLRDINIPGLDYRNFDMSLKYAKGALTVTKQIFELIKSMELTACDESFEKIMQRFEKDGYSIEKESVIALFSLYEKYDEILKHECLLEFADQELLLFKLATDFPEYFDDLDYQHIIIDEFQDSNERQMHIVKMLTNTKSFKSLMVVGDDSQSIYGFRNTTPEYIINFYNYIGMQGKDFYLVTNHRSTPQIIDFANRINRKNTNRVSKELVSTKTHGIPVTVNGYWNKDSEYAFIRNMIRNRHSAGVKYEDMAFIASTKTELNNMSELLKNEGIPTVMLNPEPRMENPYIVAALELVHFMMDPEYIQGGITYYNCLQNNCVKNLKKDDLDVIIENLKNFRTMFSSADKDNKKSAIIYYLNALYNGDEVYDKFLEIIKSKSTYEQIANYCMTFLKYGENTTTKRENYYAGVALTTAHSSKGLEWSVVFNSISGFDSEELHVSKNVAELEERRRLFFVSCTRAKEELYVTGKYIGYGNKTEKNYNMFLKEAYAFVGKDFMMEVEPPKESKKSKAS